MVYSSDLKSLHFLMGLILQKHLIMPIMVFIWTRMMHFFFCGGNVLICFFFFFLQPVGALNPKRAAFYAKHYENWESEQAAPYHYSSHYSTAASTLHWLFRIVSKITPSSTLDLILVLRLKSLKYSSSWIQTQLLIFESAWADCHLSGVMMLLLWALRKLLNISIWLGPSSTENTFHRPVNWHMWTK